MKRLFAILSLFLLAACGGGSSGPPLAQYASGDTWRIVYSANEPPALIGNTYFDFAQGNAGLVGNGVHYVIHTPMGVAVGKTITMTFKIEGGGTIVPTGQGDQPPAIVRLFIERQGDHLQASEEFFRWWSNPVTTVLKGDGTFTMTVPVTPDQWSSVFGKMGNSSSQATAGFNDCVAHAGNVGFTFGGMFAGHGDAVLAPGQARFTLLSFTIQ